MAVVTGCTGVVPATAEGERRPRATGADGDASGPVARSTVWGVSAADGSVVRSSGLVSLRREVEGRYEVRFNQDVSECAYARYIRAARC